MSNKVKAWLITLALLSICLCGALNEMVLILTILTIFTGFGLYVIATVIEIILNDN